MEFLALGDTDDIAASCHYLGIEGTGVVLDAGVDPRHDGKESLPRFDLIHDAPDRYIDHALITHAHHDHIGSIPVLIKEFPHALAHMTDATRRLLDFLLPASARLQKRRIREGSAHGEPLFTEDDLKTLDQLFMTHELGEDFDITSPSGTTPVTARFYTAGHILGSVGVELRFEDDGRDRRVFYTSDTNMQAQSILPGGEYPDSTDVLILESTLGDDPEAELTSRPKEIARFKEVLAEVLERGGTALIPVFVMGRAQETLALLQDLKDAGDIADDVPIYTAGSMRAIADIYDKTRDTTPRLDSDFRVFGVDQSRLPRSDQGKDDAFDGPSICVVSSGMMFEPTLSNLIGRRLVGNEDDAILLVGYAKEDTPAARLKAAADTGPGTEVVLNPETGPQEVHCTVDAFRFTGHSNRQDLLQIVNQLAPETVVLVHGDVPAREWMAKNIRYHHPEVDVLVPEGGKTYEIG